MKQESEINYRFTIIEIVESRTAINDISLVMSIMGKIGPMEFNRVKYDEVINRLVQEQEIMELRYLIKNRVRLIYFPKGTIFSHIENGLYR